MEQALRRFLWKGPDIEKGGAKVAWDELTFPLEGALESKDYIYGILQLWESTFRTYANHLPPQIGLLGQEQTY